MIHDSIARYLARVYDDLADRNRFSTTIAHDISDAPALGQAKRLVVMQCDSDDLGLSSTLRASWIADEHGFRKERAPFTDCPRPSGGKGFRDIPEGYEIENPYIRFGTDGNRVRIGIRFGPQWYVVKECELDGNGVPNLDSYVVI